MNEKNRGSDVRILDTYFRRFFVPVIITLLVFAAIYVVIRTPPGTPSKWETFATASQALFGTKSG